MQLRLGTWSFVQSGPKYNSYQHTKLVQNISINVRFQYKWMEPGEESRADLPQWSNSLRTARKAEGEGWVPMCYPLNMLWGAFIQDITLITAAWWH